MIETTSQKISIVMSYYNRKAQTLKTLDGFENKYAGKYNFEVVIVDDNSDDDNSLILDIKKYSYPINLIVISKEEKGTRVNPCIAYNRGFERAQGDIVLIQNPECYHVGNILGHVHDNLKEQDYYTYSCFSTNSHELTEELLKSENKSQLINDVSFLSRNEKLSINWYNHPTEKKSLYHFCSAIYKSKLDLIGGFDKRFARGLCFDDDELLLSIKYNLKLNIKIIDHNICFVIHQFHGLSVSTNCDIQNDDHPIKSKWLINKKLYETLKNNHERVQFKYPKLMFLYWDGSPLSFLNYLTVISFNHYNKEWKIIIFTPTSRTSTDSWETGEQKLKYTKKCYFDKLSNIENVIIQKIDLNKIGFNNEESEVIKSDYFRYYILKKHGGLWSDFDIMYTGSIEDRMNFTVNTVIFKCYDHIGEKEYIYYPIGFFLTIADSSFFTYILDNCIKFYDRTSYQSIGAQMFKKLFPTDESIFKIDKSIKLCDNNYYLPWAWNKLDNFLVKKENTLPPNNIGIHWFNGAQQSKQYAINLENRLEKFQVECYMDEHVLKYLDKNKIK